MTPEKTDTAPAPKQAQVDDKDNGSPTQNGYIGVDPIYQNHANDYDAPLAAGSGVEKQLEDIAVKAANDLAEQSKTVGLTGYTNPTADLGEALPSATSKPDDEGDKK